MNEACPEDHAAWCADGLAFRISDPQRFADHCLPRFFKHNKLGSFQQQLLTYGFSRVPNESCLDISAIWKHPKFMRGQPEILEQIQRAAGKGKGDDKAAVKKEGATATGGAVVVVGANEDEADAVDPSGELRMMQDHLSRLGASVHELRSELRSAREYEMSVLEELVRRVDRRLGRPPQPPPEAEAAPEAAAAAPAASMAEGSLPKEAEAAVAGLAALGAVMD
jgi:hypothetical protein